MFVSYVKGVPSTFSGERHIVHMLSSNLWDWEFHSILRLSSDYVIDACVFRLPGGSWRIWHKDEDHGSFTYAADSPDLLSWTVQGPVITDCPHEGPNVFHWQDAYWMVTDHWHGLGVYQSEDCQTWTRRADILGIPGKRPDDGALGHHADVLVQGKNAFVFYFTHPENTKRSSLQVAQLEFKAGQLICDRDKPFDLILAPGVED
jgi:hypothetical protein